MKTVGEVIGCFFIAIGGMLNFVATCVIVVGTFFDEGPKKAKETWHEIMDIEGEE